MIGASISPDSSGAFLIETKLSQPISLEGNDVLTKIASELPPDRLFPSGTVGGAGMLVPAQYSGGELVSTYQPGQSIDLAAAIDSFGRQLNGETVSDPYVFSPNTRRFLVDTNTNALIGWQTIMLGPPDFGSLSAYSMTMGDDGSNPTFTDGASSMSGWWSAIYGAASSGMSYVNNFFLSDAPLWQKATIGSAALIVGFLCTKAIVAAAGVGVLASILAGTVGTVAAGVSAFLGSCTATGLNYFSNEAGNGYAKYAQSGGMPSTIPGKIGYAAAAAVDAAAKTQQLLIQLKSDAQSLFEDAKNKLWLANEKFNAAQKQFGSWFEKLKPWLIGAIFLGGGYAAYNIWGKNR